MHAVVTGAAGFIGSHLCAHLLDQGDEVVGVDCLTDTYDVRRKEANLATLSGREGFTEQRLDLTSTPLSAVLDRADVLYHVAGQPGVRASWGDQFGLYLERNVLATQCVLEAAQTASLWKVVYASSYAVYGAAARLPTGEDVPPHPVSPFGATTLAAENLLELYRKASGLSTVSLRLFSVYGPRQRPDVAFHRLLESAVRRQPFLLYGDGEQTRDFVHVDDVVTAMRQAALSPWAGIANIGGASRTTINKAIETMTELVGPIDVVHLPAQRGEVRHAAADTSTAALHLGYTQTVPLREGLARMVDARANVLAAAAPPRATSRPSS